MFMRLIDFSFRNCAKRLALIHSRVGESKLRAVFKKYSRSERFAVALVTPAESLVSPAP